MSVVGHLRRVVAQVRRRVGMLLDAKYRELERLRTMARFTPSTTALLGRSLKLVDGRSFYYAYEEIWRSRCYEFRSEHDTPLLTDA